MRITENSDAKRLSCLELAQSESCVVPWDQCPEDSKAGLDCQMKDLKPGPSYSLCLFIAENTLEMVISKVFKFHFYKL